MKKIIVFLVLIIATATFNISPSYAAFVVKGKSATAPQGLLATLKNDRHDAASKIEIQQHVNNFLTKISHKSVSGESYGHNRSAWPGIVALAFGISAVACLALTISGAIAASSGISAVLGTLVGWIVCSILALVFGIIGSKKEKHTMSGMGKAGLILGCIQLGLIVLISIIFGIANLIQSRH